ncbi:MAG: FAD-dependent oxidoreductase [bacterium]|nr:FAD-dependent oxidoreductase [bacterium]
MKYNYHIIVIGGGSGGLVIASAAAGLGADVALIEKEKMGGDCLNYGCIPSKTFLKSAHLASDIRNSHEFGLNAAVKNVNLEKVMARVKSVIKEAGTHDSKERYEKLGVKVYFDRAVLKNRHTVQLSDKQITGKYIVIATGSEPFIPDIAGLKNIDYLTNRNIFKLNKLPEHLIVLGGGPIGLELGQGFCHLGSKVTIIDRNQTLFKKDDPEVWPVLQKKFIDDGIDIRLSSKIEKINRIENKIEVVIYNNKYEVITGSALLVSSGRSPVSKGFGLEEAGIVLDQRGYIKTNAKMQTRVSNIYACGDVTGPYQFTHMAAYQAGVVIKNIIFKLGSKVDYSSVPWTTYTKPEVAHAGYTQQLAESRGIFHSSVIVDLATIDRAKTENDRTGLLKLNLNRKKQIAGAAIVSEKGGELIPLVTLAIKKKMKATEFLDLIFSYPTEAEIFKSASIELIKQGFKSWHKKLIKKLFLR